MFRRLISLRSVYLKITIFIEVFLLAFTFCIFPVRADSIATVQLRQSYLSGTVSYNGRTSNLDTSYINYVLNEKRNLPDGSRHSFSGYAIDLNAFQLYSGNVGEMALELKFSVFPQGENLSRVVTDVQFITGLFIDGYQSSYNYGIDSVSLDGVPNDPAHADWGYYLGWRNYTEFYNFSYYEVSGGGSLTGNHFSEITVNLRWTGRPNVGQLEILFDDTNYIKLADYSSDLNGVVNGLDDINGSVIAGNGKLDEINDSINQPLSSEDSEKLDYLEDTGDQVRADAESMAEALDQFDAPTDEISDVNNSLSDALDEYSDAVDILSLDFTDSSEFFNTVTIIGVPGLGICFLGYILYGKKE